MPVGASTRFQLCVVLCCVSGIPASSRVPGTNASTSSAQNMVRSLETKACPSTGRLIEVAFYRVRAYCGFGYWPHVIEVGCRLRCSLGASITDRSKELYTPRFSLGTSVISPLVEWKNCEIETDLGNGLYCCAMAHSDRFIKPAPRSCLIAEWTNFHPLAGRTASREVCGLGFLFPTNCHAQSSRGIVSGRCFAGAGTAILHGEELVVWRALLWCVQVSRGAWLHVWIARYVGVSFSFPIKCLHLFSGPFSITVPGRKRPCTLERNGARTFVLDSRVIL